MPTVNIDIQIFPPGHPLAPIHAPLTTDADKDDLLKFKVRILDNDVESVEIRFNDLELLDQAGTPPPPRGRKRKKGRKPANSRKIDFKGKAEHSIPKDVVSDKYTITTFNDADVKKDALDPIIIICDPL